MCSLVRVLRVWWGSVWDGLTDRSDRVGVSVFPPVFPSPPVKRHGTSDHHTHQPPTTHTHGEEGRRHAVAPPRRCATRGERGPHRAARARAPAPSPCFLLPHLLAQLMLTDVTRRVDVRLTSTMGPPYLALRAFSPSKALSIFTASTAHRAALAPIEPLSPTPAPRGLLALAAAQALQPGPPWAPKLKGTWTSALGFVGICSHPLLPVYQVAVAELRSMRIADISYHRPAAKARTSTAFAQVRPSGSPGGYPSLVGECHDPFHHISLAHRALHPFASKDDSLPHSVLAAIDFVCKHGQHTQQLRASRMQAIRRVAKLLEPLNSCLLRPLMPPSVWLLSGGYNLAFMAALIDALEWPDVSLVQRFTLGFPIIGHIPDSGVFRPLPYSTPSLLTDDLCRSNADYTAGLMPAMVARAASDPDASEVWAKTVEEVGSGLVIGPFTRSELDRAFGFGVWRPIPRFGTWQKGKLRPIDDALRSKLNAAQCMSEALVCGSADFGLHVARAFALRIGPRFALCLGTDDIASAYRMIPCAHPQYTVVCLSQPGSGRASFFLLPGLNFGLACAPVHFNRFPELVTFAARLLLAIPCDHFYDDTAISDLQGLINSSQGCLGELYTLLGLPFSESKHVVGSASEPYLGVQTDYTRLHTEGLVSLSLKPSRREKLLGLLDAAISSRSLRRSEAASLSGKLMFAVLSVFGKVGRAALCDVRAHASGGHSAADPAGVSDALLQTLVFFRTLIHDLPSLTVPALPPVECPVLVWSDASFCRGDVWLPVPESGCVAGLGFVAYSPYTGAFVCSAWVVPPPLLASLFRPHEQYVGILENLAAQAVAFSVPTILSRRLVLHFVDNQGALSNLVSGSSTDPDSRAIVYDSALQMAKLGARAWYEWVESEANIADLPSRGVFSFTGALLGADGSRRASSWVPMRFSPAIEAQRSAW